MSILIMSRLFRAQLGSSSRKMLAVRLADFADDSGKGIWPSVETLSQETELSCRTVQRLLADFVKEGLLVIVKKASGRPGESTRYDFDMRAIDRLPDAKAHLETGDTMSPVEGNDETGDTMSRVTLSAETGDTDGIDGCHHVTRTVIEPSIEPSLERGARESGFEEKEDRSDDPSKFNQRVKALEIGRHNNPWPNAIGSSTAWAVQQFAKLSSEERSQAEERRDAYLVECERRKIKPVALGVYLRDRKFLDVAATVAKAGAVSVERTQVAPFGPVWSGLCVAALLDGPVAVEQPHDLRGQTASVYEAHRRSNEGRALAYLAKKGVSVAADGTLIFPDDFEQADYRIRVMETGYPELRKLYQLAADRERGVANGKFSRLSQLCEAVPVGSEVYEAWREHYQAHDWPWIPDPGKFPVVWFPKGGPFGLEAFRIALSEMRNDDGSHEKGTDNDAA